MKDFIKFFIKNELLVNLFIAIVVLLGILGLSNMNSSFFPKAPERFIIIEAIYPGASPREVEEGITLKIEDNLKGVSGIDRVTSTSQENTARITVELDYGQNADLVLQDVKNAVDQISNFPADMEQLVVYVLESQNPTARVAITGDVPLRTLKESAENFEDNLRTFPNLSKISLSGFTSEEIEIALTEAKLRAFGLAFEDVARAIQSENIKTTGGRIKSDTEVIIRADQREYYADQLGDIVVKTLDDGSVVRLSDVATISEDWSEDTNMAYYNGERAIIITISTLNEENILDAAASVVGYIDTFNQQNTVVKAHLIEDGTVVLQERISLLTENGVLGAFLVFVLLAMFLRIRLAFWVAIGIPISFLGMFIFLNLTGITINVLSLFGMILVVGILVDDGIVVGENIFQQYEKGKTKFRAVLDGTLEVIPAISSAIATTCLAFSFFYFIDGQLGEFFSDVAAVVIFALGFSLVEVLLFLPAHLAHIKDLTGESHPNKLKVKVENLLIKFRDYVFKPILIFVLRYKVFAFMLVVAGLIVTIGAIRGGIIKTTFFPNIEQNKVQVTLEYPSGTSESTTENTIRQIESAVKELGSRYEEEFGAEIITDIEWSVGPGSNKGLVTCYLVSSEDRDLRSFQIAADLRNAVGPIPNATQLSFETATPFGKPLNISFSGSDFSRLRLAVEDFKQEALKTGLVKDLVTNDQADQPEIKVTLNEAGRALGFSTQEVIQKIRYGFFGFEAQRLQRGDDEVKVWVRYDIKNRQNVESLMDMRIRTSTGALVPIREIATLTPVNGLIAISHLDGKQQITMQGEVSSFDVSSTEMINKISADVIPVISERYPDLSIALDGQQRETAKLAASVAKVGPIILVLMAALLILTFRSVSQSVALLLIVPFGLIGAGWGHYIHGLPMSLLSFLGFIALIGVIVNDGLVFVGAFNSYLREGKKYDDALMETALSRFRPIFLTTITTAAGLAPLILERSFQAQFLVPMAITIAYGLLVGSFLLILILPVFLSTFNRAKVWIGWLVTGEKPTHESVEKAVIRQLKEEEYESI
ncbi:efflux RND transporter permease subunit [Fulvivirga sedimenti]|uniref:Efflux RND transporter permease subunit n=1 Tax=Fulvivirga sedimenti TaxID=2879465 RepID=A0A9X1HLP9_9BACT|nr:efflux RND transporter permease subunit [Fulvivirga sedimenti]MCA6074310.1 efflux RND transporter permease subunit [Fulvivirga sedimenti]